MIPMDELGPGKFSHRSNPLSLSIEHTVTHRKVQLFLWVILFQMDKADI